MVLTNKKQTMLLKCKLTKKKDIKGCIEERIKNDKDIDAIRFAITSNQKIIKDILEKMEALEDALAERKSEAEKVRDGASMVVSDQDSDNEEAEEIEEVETTDEENQFAK